MKNFLNYLDSVCKKLDDKYDINSGGCCYVASVIAAELEKRNIPFKFISYKGKYHLAIQVGEMVINRDGCTEGDWWSSFDKADKILNFYKSEEWNYVYNRKWNLIIKTIIQSKFKYYDNNRNRFYIKT